MDLAGEGVVNDERAKAVYWIAALAIAAGLLGAINAIRFPVDPIGRVLVGLFPINVLGGFVLIGLGAVAVAGGYRRSAAIVVLGGLASGFLALTQLAGIGESWNRLGGHASTASLFLAIAVGLLALGLTPRESGPVGG